MGKGNGNKLSWYNVLCAIGIILWTLGFFFGLNYTVKSAYMLSIPVSIVLGLLMWGLVYAMKKLSRERSSSSRKTGYLCVALYALVAICSALYFMHFAHVTLDLQAETKDLAIKEIQELNLIYDDSDEPSPQSYASWVEDECESLRISLEGESEETKNFRVAQLRDQLLTESGYVDTEAQVQEFLGRSYAAIANWNWFTVSDYLNQLETRKPEFEAQAVEFSKSAGLEGEVFYNFESQHNYTGLAAKIGSLSTASFNVWAIILMVVIQAMILLTYFMTMPKENRGNTYRPTWQSNSKKKASGTGKSDSGDDDE